MLPNTLAWAEPWDVYETDVPDCLYWLDDQGNAMVWLLDANVIAIAGEPADTYVPRVFRGHLSDLLRSPDAEPANHGQLRRKAELLTDLRHKLDDVDHGLKTTWAAIQQSSASLRTQATQLRALSESIGRVVDKGAER